MRLWDNATALKRLYHWLYVFVIACLFCSIGIWAINSPYFPVRHIKVITHLKHVDAKDVERISQQYLYGNIFIVDVNAAQQALAKLPWVDKVQVKRVWPDVVQIHIQERIPIAQLGNGQLVDEKGKLFKATTKESLPLFTESVNATKNMTIQLSVFENLLRPVGLHVNELHLNERSAWEVVLNNGILIKLGREHEQQRLSRFVEVWPQVLHSQEENIDYVDMRYPDGFALRYKK